ncbi:MAG TPA: hypothetical protein VNJ12_00230 [Candidatus Dormibacteraeota bacterium]|nr:hypothetical protein [Candidatus Dormibacteraeota bacterium]
MHDAAAIEDAGIPSIVLIHDVFQQAAGLQAEILGRRGLARVVFPQGKPEMSDEEVDQLAGQAVDQVMAILRAS